ncbi:MAG: aminotransferase class V-fold PLP-dependent enzyme [Deltaproteobacteria bacterium]|nr:aminotransferase class V-fold PLP-dependent enzyme [Deltaproteobacteria bacterium]
MKKSQKVIKANLEYLRKLFIMPDSPDKFVEFGKDLLEMIHDFFQEKGGIHSKSTLPELSKIFDQTALPDNPYLIKDVLAEIKKKIIDHSVKVGNPYYIGHMTSAIPYFMIHLEMIIASLNQNQVKIETAKASSFVERELTAWFHRLIFNKKNGFYKKNIQNPHVSLGNITADGTLSNMTALMVAREKAFPPGGDFQGLRATGVNEALDHYGYSKAVILVSARGHYSIRKAANVLGLGEENVITIPVDDGNHIDIKKLQRKVAQLQDRNYRPKTKIIAIIGIAGTTETGNIDDLESIGEIARRAGAHFHVDACWGGPTLLVDEYRHLFKGIEKADSVSIDAHKLLYCPMSMGLVLFNNEKDLNTIRHSSNYIIRKNSVDMGRFTIEGSRSFACLKPWAALKIISRKGYGLLLGHALKTTDYMKKKLDSCDNFESLNSPELFILIYRFIPGNVRKRLSQWKLTSTRSDDIEKARNAEKKIRKVNQLINSLNVKLHREIRKDDTTFVSRTTIESTIYRPQNIVVLRAVLINPLTDNTVLNEIIGTQNRIGLQLWHEFEAAYNRILKTQMK